MNGTTSKNVAPYIVAALVSVFLIVIAYMMFFVPKMAESKALVGQAATTHASNVALTSRADKLEAIAGNLGPLKAQVGEFSQSFPSAARQQEMIDALNEAAVSTGVTLTTLSPNAPKPIEEDPAAAAAAAAAPAPAAEAGAKELPGAVAVKQAAAEQQSVSTAQLGTVSLKIDGKGSLEAVRAFIAKVESLQRPLVVHQLQIEKQEGSYHVMLNGETFLAGPLAEPAGKSADASGEGTTESK